jgi:hypothetical protein
VGNARLRATTTEDLLLIKRWIEADPWHSLEASNEAEWLLTGGGLLSFCLADAKGPLCFVRLDKDDNMARVAIQFGPEAEVSKRRLIVGLMRVGFPSIISFAKKQNFKGIVFESINPELIEFLKKHQGVVKTSTKSDDYALIF